MAELRQTAPTQSVAASLFFEHKRKRNVAHSQPPAEPEMRSQLYFTARRRNSIAGVHRTARAVSATQTLALSSLHNGIIAATTTTISMALDVDAPSLSSNYWKTII